MLLAYLYDRVIIITIIIIIIISTIKNVRLELNVIPGTDSKTTPFH